MPEDLYLPVLAAFAPLASLLLGLNIAYLRLDRFLHRGKIRERAESGLAGLFPNGTHPTKEHKDSQHYQRLIYLAERPRDEDDVQSGKTNRAKHVNVERLPGLSGLLYSAAFRNERDRKAAGVMAWAALATVVFGTLDAAGLTYASGYVSQCPWIALSVAVFLPSMLVLSVALVLAGDGYISKAFEVIDDDVWETGLISPDKPSQGPSEFQDFLAGFSARSARPKQPPS